ncbi:hypothetical protein GWA97_10650 [Flavobacterium sp. LaA7.5]|nr:hypothetical protein [Flavobacterium salilacus subsp. altitudinum]
MKTKHFFTMLLTAGIFTVAYSQTHILGSNATSVGLNAGVMGSTGSTFFGYYAGKSTISTNNTFIGANSGYSNTSGTRNTFIGENAGYNSNGSLNVFVGGSAGLANTSGYQNVFVGGYGVGLSNTSGYQNVFIGTSAGGGNTTGSYNTYIGQATATGYASTGSYNVALGYGAGSNNNGSNNVFIGKNAGSIYGGGPGFSGTTYSDQLFIDNSSTQTPLIRGDFAANTLVFNGRVGITNEALADQANLFPTTAGGVNVNSYQLFVKGGILTEEIRVNLKSPSNWADYVFEENYTLLSLEEVECFIQENGHLPNVPSAETLSRDGLNLSEIAKIQQEKIEELTLYIIEQNKRLKVQEEKLNQLAQQQKEIDELKAFVSELKNKEK